MNIAQQIGGNTAVDLVLDLTADKDGAKYLLDATYEHGVKRVLVKIGGFFILSVLLLMGLL